MPPIFENRLTSAAPGLSMPATTPPNAAPQFDDSQWTRRDIGKSLHLPFPSGSRGAIWYRMRVKVVPDQIGLRMARIFSGSLVIQGTILAVEIG